jgi:hypothetical protein
MADGRESLKMQKVFLLEDLRDETHLLVDLDAITVSGGDTCALLTSMLEGIKSKKGDSGDVFTWCVDTKDAARFVEALQKDSPRLFLERQAARKL